MRYQLDLTLRQAEGALVRVLGTAERRGFRTLSFTGDTPPGSDRMQVSLVVEGERPDTALAGQLAKLYDCVHVQVAPCP